MLQWLDLIGLEAFIECFGYVLNFWNIEVSTEGLILSIETELLLFGKDVLIEI